MAVTRSKFAELEPTGSKPWPAEMNGNCGGGQEVLLLPPLRWCLTAQPPKNSGIIPIHCTFTIFGSDCEQDKNQELVFLPVLPNQAQSRFGARQSLDRLWEDPHSESTQHEGGCSISCCQSLLAPLEGSIARFAQNDPGFSCLFSLQA